ncbi:MAG: KH domain-containing protein [Flavonifractor plautii]
MKGQSHKGIIIGKGGRHAHKKISTLAREDVEAFMGAKVLSGDLGEGQENWRDNI